MCSIHVQYLGTVSKRYFKCGSSHLPSLLDINTFYLHRKSVIFQLKITFHFIVHSTRMETSPSYVLDSPEIYSFSESEHPDLFVNP